MPNQYLHDINSIPYLDEDEKNQLTKVTEFFRFKVSQYYLSLIDWSNPNDPIRRLVIPDTEELNDWGTMDASGEKNYTIMPGLQHKYHSTALLLVSNRCASLCRYCFRKRIFVTKESEIVENLDAAMEYIANHKEITNVLCSGGDALMLPTSQLSRIIKQLRDIEHVLYFRLGTKMLAFNPFRITEDPELVSLIAKYSTHEKRIYIITHFSHPKEITPKAIEAVGLLIDAGAILANQTPIIRGINDHPDTITELMRKLTTIGIAPYYIFQCRPAVGNLTYAVPLEVAYDIIETAKTKLSGLAKRIRFVMSHKLGKIEIIGKDRDSIYFKFHRAAAVQNSGKIMVFPSNPEAFWLDDYLPQTTQVSI